MKDYLGKYGSIDEPYYDNVTSIGSDNRDLLMMNIKYAIWSRIWILNYVIALTTLASICHQYKIR